LRDFSRAHLPFAKDFEQLHKIPLTSVLAVIGAVALETLHYWQDAPERIIQYWQRAYILQRQGVPRLAKGLDLGGAAAPPYRLFW
jgi:hypothetical protein